MIKIRELKVNNGKQMEPNLNQYINANIVNMVQLMGQQSEFVGPFHRLICRPTFYNKSHFKIPPTGTISKSNQAILCRFNKGMLPTAIKMPVRRKSSLKKPVKDVSNLKYPPTSSKSLTTTPTTTQDFNRSKPEDLDDSLDRLLLLQSDLSALTHQVLLSISPPF